MPKSEFDEHLAVSGRLVRVTGVVDPDTNARAQESGADVDVHWVVAQGDLVAHGHVHADGKTFTQSERGTGQDWKDGPAHASGVTVTVSLSPRPPRVEAFKWHQEVQLEVG